MASRDSEFAARIAATSSAPSQTTSTASTSAKSRDAEFIERMNKQGVTAQPYSIGFREMPKTSSSNSKESKAFASYTAGKQRYGSTAAWFNNIKSERNKARTALFSLNDEKKSRDTLNRAKATWAAENWSRDEVEEDDLDERITAAERALQMAEEEYGYAKYYNDLEMDSAWEQNLRDQGISWGNAYTSTYQAQAGLQRQIDNVYAELQSAQRENKNAGVFGAGMREEASAARVAELEETYDRLLDQMEMVGRRNQYALDMMTKDAQAVERGQLRGDFLLEQDERTQQQGKAEFIENYTKGNTMGGVWDALRSDRSDFMPTNAWSQEQLLEYQTLLGYGYEDRAREYAAATNKSINDAKMKEATAPKYEWGYGADATGVGRALRTAAGTVATVATAPERLASYLNKVQDVYTTGVYTGEDRAQLHDYAEAIASGRAQAMNDRHGTIDGKGWGDLYQAINSVAQSMVYGNALGKAGTLAIFFGQAADSGFDEAIARGATGEQAALSGLLSGAAEVIAEKMPLDNLLATDKAAARGLAKSILKQAGIEGAEEGITSLMNTFADKLVMGDKSALDQQIKELMAEGMSYEDARAKTMRDYANSVAWDVVIGAVSGGVSSGVQYGVDAISPYTDRYGADARTLVDEARQIKDRSDTLRKAEKKVSKGKSISNATAKKLVTTVNRSRMVDAVEKQINTRSPEMEQKTARSLANAVVAKSRSERMTDNWQKLISKNSALVSEIEKDMNDTKPADWVKAIGVRGAEAAVYGDRNVINARQQREQTLLNTGEYSESKAANIEDGQDVQEYSDDFDVVAEVFGNSNNFQSFDEVWNTIKADTILTEAQARNAWETGKARLAKTDMTPRLTRRGTGKLRFEAVSDGGVQYEAPSAEETETFKRSARYQYLAALSKKIGVDIVFFKGGAEGINGKYQNGTVYLAIDASPTKYDTVDGYVMLTAAHELTHYIREASPARYAELKDFVTKHLIEQGKLENGKTLTALIAAKRRAYADAGVELSVDAAVEEVIADACEMMLKDNTLVAELRGESPGLHGMMSKWLKKFMAKVKTAFTGLEAYHAEAKGMMDSFDELQRIWNLGLTDAAQAEVTEAEGESVPDFALKDDAEILHLKEQIVRAQEQLEQMQPVANITFDKEIPKQVSEKRSMLEGLLKSNKVIDSLVVGKVEFDTKRIGKGLTYARTDADIAGFLAVPAVIKRGVIIEYHPQHKGGKASTSQDVESWTIAAPVVLNGKRGNMGVIVQKTTGMFYKAHKVLMPDGSAFLLDEVNKKEKANPGPVHGATTSGRLDEPTRFASDTRISETNEKGKGKLSLKDDAYMSAVDTDDMETAQSMVDEAAERAGYDIKAYHGTPNGTFTVFKDWQYFTEDREYADIYQNQGASSNGYKVTAQNPKTYSVFLKLSNVFDTRNPKEQRIFNDEFYRKWGNGAPLSERGLPDWTDGDDLIEFFEENGYNYDAVLIDEGGTGGYGDAVNDRGISIVVKESSQIKSADPVTYDDAGNVIPLSQRFNERQPDIRYSIKDEAQSDRMLLANTLMTAAQNDGERRRLNNYKAQIDVFADIQQQLADAEDELSRAYRAGDKQAIAKAQRERNALTEKLIRADKKLLELQATKPLKELMARVKQDTRRHTQRLSYERRNKKELRDKIKKLHKDMTAQLLKPKENKYVPTPLLKTVAELLDEINLDSGRSEKIKAKMTELSGQYQAIAKSNEYGYAFDNEVAGMIAQLQSVIAEKDDTSIYHMSKAELEMVYNTMKAINHTVRESVKLIGVEENRNIFELAKAMMRETGKANPVANKLANKYINATLRPDVFFKRMGGYVKNSVWQFMGDMLNEAQRKQTQLQMEGAAIFEELMRDTDAFDKMTDPKNLIDIGLEDESGNPVLVTMDIALKIYMDTMAEDNARHFMSGGYTIPNMREYYKGKVSDAFSRGSVTVHGFGPLLADLEHQLRSAETEAEQDEIQQKIEQAEADAATWVETLRQNIYEQMGEYELEWVSAAEKFFNQFSQRVLNETTMAVYGFEKATVPYYVPIHTDAAYRQANFESISRDMSLENSGFMKQRVKASNPVLAEGIVDVVNGQIDKVAKYAAMMPAIRNFQKVYGKSTSGFENSVQASVRSKYGNEALKYIENIITDLTSPRRTEGGLLGEFADRLRGNLAQAALSVNIRVAGEQMTSYPKAAVIVGYGPLLKAMRDIRNNPVFDQTAREEIAQWTPLMWYRMQGYFDRDIGDLRKQDRLIKFLPKWIEFVEGATVGQMWYAAQYYVEDTTDLERGTDEFMQETAKVFNRIVEQTQANYTMFQRPDILRNPNAIVKQLTMFMTERLQNANMVFDAVGTYNAYARDYRNGENDVTEEDVEQAKQTVVRTTSSLIAATAASVAFKLVTDALLYSMKGYRDDDEELTAESISGQVIENFFESIAGNFLWGSELFSVMRSVITGETYYGISLGGVETFTDALNALVKTIQEPTEENWKKSIKTAMQMLGIPLNNGIKIYNAIAYRVKDAQEDNYWGDFASEVKLTDEQRNKQLYKAVVNGDDKKVNRLFEYYGTEADADAALAKHIKTMYQNDELSAEEAQAQLEDYASMSEYDAKLDISKLTCKKETGIAYENLQQAFIDKQITEEQAVEYRAKYGLYDKSDAEKEVRQWACERETGYAYDDLPRYLASEDITKQQAIEYRMEYGGQDLEDATVQVTKWMGEIETGIPYNKVEDYYRDGLVTYDELVDYYMKYWSYDELKAIQVADKRTFIGTDERLEEASLAAVSGYYGYCEEANVDKYTYLTAYQFCYAVRADKDENGKSISGTALKKKLVYIDGLNLQPFQKTAIAKAIGITDKQLKKYKAAWL